MAERHSTSDSWRAQLATLVDQPPEGNGWLHEIKFDGYRIAARLDAGQVRLMTRNLNDWTSTFPEVVAAVRALEVRQALLDGEVAILLKDGRTDFQELQNAIARKPPRPGLVYFAFDLLELDGEDLRPRPVEERKKKLETLLADVDPNGVLRYSQHVVGGGDAVFAQACRLGVEGIISKRLGQPYRAGRSSTWVKTKCIHRQEFAIGGFTDPEGVREAIGALLVGFHDPSGVFRFAGKVGTGFTNASARALKKRLAPLAQKTCPFVPPPEGWLGRNAHWVTPRLVCEVVFTEWTREGRIRHPSFQGLREDKTAAEVVQELPSPGPAREPATSTTKKVGKTATKTATRPTATASRAKSSTPANSRAETVTARGRGVPAVRRGTASTRAMDAKSPVIAGVRLSHPERVFWPDVGITKKDLATFYEEIAEWVVPHVRGRPLTLFRCPERIGEDCYFMKHSKIWAPEQLRRERIQEKTKLGEYLIADDLAGLVGLVQMDVIEVHTWNSKFEHVEEPDRVVLDLDPGPDVPWKRVVDAAKVVRATLEVLGLRSFVKTTGGVGLHIVVPLAPVANWKACLEFTRVFAEAIVRQDPRGFTTAFARKGREDKILIDYLRNNRTNTSVAAFSPRARPGAPVSVPLSWDELSARLRSDAFTLRTVPRRLAKLREDPWKEYWQLRQRIPRDAIAALAHL